MHYRALFTIGGALLVAGFLLGKWYGLLWRRHVRESYWPLKVFLLFLAGVFVAAVLNRLLLVPIVVIPVTIFAWWRYWPITAPARTATARNHPPGPVFRNDT